MGRPGRFSSAFNKGCTAGHRPWPKTLGDLNNSCDDPNGGGGCIVHLPPSLVMHALCMHTTKQQSKEPSEQRREGEEPDQTDQKEPKKNPKTRKRSRRGWVRIRDMKHPRIHIKQSVLRKTVQNRFLKGVLSSEMPNSKFECHQNMDLGSQFVILCL